MFFEDWIKIKHPHIYHELIFSYFMEKSTNGTLNDEDKIELEKIISDTKPNKFKED